ncbi:MAG: CRTAC1 family protein, partial [Planctomycetota bacterium]
WNQDGFWDIAIGNFGANQLLINQGDGTFLDRSDLIADNKALMTASLAMADLDGDGLSDWIEVNYVDDPAVFDPIPVTAAGYPSLFVGPNKFRAATDRVGFTTTIGTTQLRNLADPSQGVADLRNADAATDATAGAEIPRIGDAAQPGLGLMVTNLDSGPGLECFIANDSRPNQCWRVTPGDRRPVQDIAMLLGLATSGTGESTACMGIAAADFNRDGFDDLAVTNWYDEWTNLYEQNSGGSFADRSPRYGLDRLSDRHVGFGMAAEDFDGDGWVDLLVGNGHVDDFSHQGIPQKMPTQVLQNIDARFEETRQSDAYFSVGHVSRSVVTADVNRDGKMDVVLTDLLDDAELLINETEAANWIQFQLVGTTSERSATGARVIIEGLPNEPTRTLAATAGYMGRGEDVLHFGLAGWTKPVSVRVQWPDGTSESYRGLAVNQRHLLTQGQSNGSGR